MCVIYCAFQLNVSFVSSRMRGTESERASEMKYEIQPTTITSSELFTVENFTHEAKRIDDD